MNSSNSSVRLAPALKNFAADAATPDAAQAALGMLAGLLDHSPNGIVTLTPAGRIETWNEAAAGILGWPAEEAVGRGFLAMFADQPEEFLYLWDRARRGLMIRQQRTQCRRRNGSLCEATVSFAPIVGGDGAPLRIALFIEDISTREKALEKLRRSEARYRLLLADLNDIVYERDLEGRFTSVNPAVTRILGWQPDEFVGKHYVELLHPEDRERAEADIARFLATGDGSTPLAVRLRRKDGGWRWLEVVGSIRLVDGAPAGVQGIARDVTERLEAEQALRASERFASQIAAATPNLLYIYDLREDRLAYVNEQIKPLLGHTAAQAAQPGYLRSRFQPGDLDTLLEEAGRLREREPSILETEQRVLNARGEWRWFILRNTGFRWGTDGKPDQLLGIAIDITERKQVVAELLAKTRLLEGIATAAPVHLYVFDLTQNRMVYSSPHLQRLLGWTSEEFLRQEPLALLSWIHPDDQAMLPGLQEQRLRLQGDDSLTFECRVRHRHGDWRWLRTREVAYERDASGKLVKYLAAAADITEEKKAMQELSEQSQFLERMANTLPVMLLLHDVPTGKLLYVSPHCQRLLGYFPEELMGRPYAEFAALVHPDDRTRIDGLLAARPQAPQAEPLIVQQRLKAKTGAWRWVETHEVALKEDEAGRPTQLLSAAVDITEAKLADDAIAQSRERYRQLVESLDGIVWEMDPETQRFTFVSPQAVPRLGYPLAKWSEPGFFESILHPNDRPWALEARRTEAGERRDQPLEYRALAADGRTVWLHDTIAAVAEQGRPARLRGIFVDITARKEAEASLDEARRFLNRITEASPHIIYVFDLREKRNIYINRQIARDLGYEPEDVHKLGPEFLPRLLHPDDAARVSAWLDRWEQVKDGEILETEYRMRRADGAWQWFLGRDTVFQRDGEGRVLQFIGTAQNITARKQAEEAYLESEERLRRLVEDADDLFILYDLQNKVQYFKAPSYVPAAETEVVGRSAPDFMPPALAARVLEQNQAVQASRKAATFVNSFIVGEERLWFSDHVYPVFSRTGELTGVGRICRNITQQKRAEAEREELQDQLERMAALSPCIHYIFDVVERRYLFVGSSFERLLGYPVAEVVAEGERFFEKVMHPDDWAELQRLKPTWDGVPDDEVLEAEFRYRHANGQYRWLRVQTVVFARGEDGQVRQRMGVAMDVTAERTAEEFRRSLDARIQQSQKLESLGILAGGIAHDFNNLLTAILGNASLVRLSAPENSPTAELIREIELASRRAADLTQQMMAYAGKGRLVFQRVDLAELARETHKLLRNTLAPQAEVRLDLPAKAPAIDGDATQLRQVLMNLLKNASEALEGKAGEIALRVAPVLLAEADVADSLLPDSARPGPHVLLEARDSGSGMTSGTLARIFDPFFTTKFTGRGLGLSAVLGIVRGHKGTLRVRSAPGEGTCFQLYFPAAPEPLPEEVKSFKEPTPHNRILVAEDNASVADLTRRILQRSGYSLVAAADGQAALALFAKNPRQFDAALIDLSLPTLPGDQLCRELRRLAPTLPIVVMSGRFSPADAEALQALPHLKLLNKPFTPSQLLQALQNFAA